MPGQVSTRLASDLAAHTGRTSPTSATATRPTWTPKSGRKLDFGDAGYWRSISHEIKRSLPGTWSIIRPARIHSRELEPASILGSCDKLQVAWTVASGTKVALNE